MQLKLQRSQREGGLLAKSILFCLDARVAFTAAETGNIRRYKLQDQLIYSSEAAKAMATGSASAAASASAGRLSVASVDDLLSSATSKMGQGLKAAALGALASMKLTITIGSLERGHHIECKSLEELLGAEEAMRDACRSLKGYLGAAATFDGREVLVDFSTDEPAIIASAPAPMLVSSEPSASLPQLAEPLPQPVVLSAIHSVSGAVRDDDRTEESIEDRIERAIRSVKPEQWNALLGLGLGAFVLVVLLVIIF